MKTLSASDRSALIRLASSLPQGSDERRAILAGLAQVNASAPFPLSEHAAKECHRLILEAIQKIGGRVTQDNGAMVSFTYPKNSAVKQAGILNIGTSQIRIWAENQDGVSGWNWDRNREGPKAVGKTMLLTEDSYAERLRNFHQSLEPDLREVR